MRFLVPGGCRCRKAMHEYGAADGGPASRSDASEHCNRKALADELGMVILLWTIVKPTVTKCLMP